MDLGYRTRTSVSVFADPLDWIGSSLPLEVLDCVCDDEPDSFGRRGLFAWNGRDRSDSSCVVFLGCARIHNRGVPHHSTLAPAANGVSVSMHLVDVLCYWALILALVLWIEQENSFKSVRSPDLDRDIRSHRVADTRKL